MICPGEGRFCLTGPGEGRGGEGRGGGEGGPKKGLTVDGRNPEIAPPKKPWNDSIPLYMP